jgi:mannose-1-phosphate guanylyltransferase/phosphomannomutase
MNNDTTEAQGIYPFKAIIMAGGEGTRLRPLTGAIPKPLAKLCGRPVLEYILDLLSMHHCSHAAMTLRYRGEQIQRMYENGVYSNGVGGDVMLSFSYEDDPLGTAGSVKKAAQTLDLDEDEPFLVISGDALCDFDLSAVMQFHRGMKTAATIITKQVSDPREYGLVITEKNLVAGFSEKPSYVNCVSDSANTGVYVLNKSLLDIMPDNQMWDFARDVFPQMLSENKRIACYREKGYWCDIGDFTAYLRAQQDILSGLVRVKTPAKRIAVSVYSDSPIPEKALIIPPCYIGKGVDIGDNAVIEGGVIGDNVSVGKGTRIFNSVVLNGVAIGSDVSVCEAVVCENAKVKSGCSIGEGSVIGQNTSLGEKAIIFPDVKVWDNKDVPDGAVLRGDLRHGGRIRPEISERGFYGETNIDITPEFAARLGCALSALNAERILIACDRNTASVAVKNAIISGLSSAGSASCDCGFAALPMLIHFGRLTGADIILQVSANARARIVITGAGGLPLSRSQERVLEGAITRSEYRVAAWNRFGEVRSVRCVNEIYETFLRKAANFRSEYNITLQCPNPGLKAIVEPIFKSVSNPAGKALVVELTASGTKAQFGLAEAVMDNDRLMLLACVDVMKNGKDAALPMDFPAAADFLAESLGRKVHRFFSCPNDKSDELARELARNEAFLFDGAFLTLYVLAWVTREKLSLKEADSALPVFRRESRVMSISVPPQRILERLASGSPRTANGMHSAGEGVVLRGSDGRVFLRSNKRGDALFMFAESVSNETARGLCDDVERKVREIMEQNGK